MEFKFMADDVSTMKEVTEDGVERNRRWVKLSIDEFKKIDELLEWTDVNPREQNLKLKPAKEMRKTLTGDCRDIFHYLNRGISISAESCTVKNIGSKKEVTLILENRESHGIFDGGHSSKVIKEALNKEEIMGKKHVMLEIFTGVEDILFDLARARNTSTQVKEKSLANLEGKFDFIKEALRGENFFENISWTENESGEITINYIIQILTAFNKNLETKSMRKTYSGSGACETAYINEFNKNEKNNQQDNPYYKMVPLYSDIFKLVDHVLVKFPIVYNKNGYESESGNFGKLKGISYKNDYYPLLFTAKKKTSYKIPNAMFFPILAAMRQLYEEGEDGMYKWIINPIKAFDDLDTKLITKVMSVYFDKGGYTTEIGKFLPLWIDTYDIVTSYLNDYLKEVKIKELEEQLARMKSN